MKSIVICLIILSLFCGGSTTTLKDSPMDTNHVVDAGKFWRLGCSLSLSSNLSTLENLSELISSTLVVPILFFYIVGSS